MVDNQTAREVKQSMRNKISTIEVVEAQAVDIEYTCEHTDYTKTKNPNSVTKFIVVKTTEFRDEILSNGVIL